MSALYNISHEFCDADALHAEITNVSSLELNKFYKVCPGLRTNIEDGSFAPLGQPRCGDGSNYSFLVSRPEKLVPEAGGEKILIELSGGGACWDSLTCALQTSFLSFPSWYSSFVGTSCGQWEDMLLCNKKVGETDFSEYTSVFIPYCTQDIHFGDNKETSYGVQHVGAHNIFGTLQWIFENFPNPESIFITGCSAGATPLPVLYDLINTHYNKDRGDNSVNIDVVADSSVFLMPISFMKNYLSTWNIGTILDKIDFDFEAYRFNENFPYAVLDHVLARSKKTDDIGYVSHDADGISLYYYKIMSEGISGLFGRDRELSSAEQDMYKMSKVRPSSHRKMNDEESDPVLIKWWEQMNNSMNLAESTHINFDSFVMEGDGHCSFGLNVPLEYEGFEDWLANLLDGDKTEADIPTAQSTPTGTISTSSNTDTLPTTNASMVDTTPIGSEANDMSAAAGQVSSSVGILVMCFLLSWKLLISHK